MVKNNIYFISKNKKDQVITGFSKNDFKNHTGISNLKYYLIVMYLRKHLQILGQVSLTLNNLLEECGYSTKSHNNSIYSDFREIIKTEIINKEYATCDVDIFTVSPNEMFSLYLSESKNIFHSNDNFIQFNIKEFEQIVNIKDKTNKSILAGVYLFVKQFILDYGDTQVARISYPSKKQIMKGIGITTLSTVENALNALVENELLFVRKNMYIEDKNKPGKYVPARNVYALDKKELAGNTVLTELESVYKTKVYNEKDVPGEIRYLNKSEQKSTRSSA